MAIVAASLLPACSWLHDTTSVDPSVLGTLPQGMDLIDVGTFPCRGSGEIGWEYQYVVVVGDDGAADGPLYDHLEAQGFVLEPSARGDWVVTIGRSDDVLLRVGPVDFWHVWGGVYGEGPLNADVEAAVADREGPMALVGLEPTDQVCEI